MVYIGSGGSYYSLQTLHTVLRLFLPLAGYLPLGNCPLAGLLLHSGSNIRTNTRLSLLILRNMLLWLLCVVTHYKVAKVLEFQLQHQSFP